MEWHVVYYVWRSDGGKKTIPTGRSTIMKAVNVTLSSLGFMSWIIDQKNYKCTTAAEENPTKISRDFHCSVVHLGVVLMSQSWIETFILSAVRVGKGLECLKLAQKTLPSKSLLPQYDEVSISFSLYSMMYNNGWQSLTTCNKLEKNEWFWMQWYQLRI